MSHVGPRLVTAGDAPNPPTAVSIPALLIIQGHRKFTPRQLAIVLLTLLKSAESGGAAGITKSQFAYVANCSSEEGVGREIAALLKTGVLIRTGFGRTAKYEIALERLSLLPDRRDWKGLVC